MKICYLCDEFPPEVHGGIGVFVKNIATGLASRGHQPIVIGFYNQKENEKITDENGITIIKLKKEKIFLNNFIIDRVVKFRKLKKLFNRIKPDLIEVQDWQGPIAFWPQINIPILTRFHGSVSFFQNELHKKTSPLSSFLEKKSITRSNYYCAVSNYVMSKTRDIFQLRGIQSPVIYNFIEINDRKFDFQDRRIREVIFFGTLTPKKGIISLVKAWKQVLDTLPDARLHIYGKDGKTDDGSSMKDFLIGQLNDFQKKRIVFYGHISHSDLLNEMATFPIAIFPSYSEAFSFAPLEAMSARCATIYSKRASGPELIEHGKDGFLIDPEDINDIAEKLLILLSIPNVCNNLAIAGYEKVKKYFSKDHILEQNLKFYDEIVKNWNSVNN